MSELVGKLYHYTSLETFLEFILPQKKLKFSELGKSRDPYESLPHNYARIPFWEDDCSDEELKQITTRVTELNQYWKYSRFVSFVSNEGSTEHKGSERPRMWDQYGERHNGVSQIPNKL